MFYLQVQCSGCATAYKNLKTVSPCDIIYKTLIHLKSYMCTKLNSLDDRTILLCVDCINRVRETYNNLQILNRGSDILASYRNTVTRLEGSEVLKASVLTVQLERIDIQNNTRSLPEVKTEDDCVKTGDEFERKYSRFIHSEIDVKEEFIYDETDTEVKTTDHLSGYTMPAKRKRRSASVDFETERTGFSANVSQLQSTTTEIPASDSTTDAVQSDRVLRKHLQCALCSKLCTNRLLLVKHLETHSATITGECKKCDDHRDVNGIGSHRWLRNHSRPAPQASYLTP